MNPPQANVAAKLFQTKVRRIDCFYIRLFRRLENFEDEIYAKDEISALLQQNKTLEAGVASP